MNCEELLIQQVEMTAAASPGTTSFVYRNAIKALPWYTLVRTKVTDPAYAKWFLPFGPPTVGNGWHVPACDDNYSPPLCTSLYHDQGQTPGYPHGDGDCAAPACDVGSVPVGEYLFDFRSLDVAVNGQTFRDFYLNEYMFGPTGLGHPGISGFYVDDDWSNGRPSEMDGNAVADMGLSPADVQAITDGYTNVTAEFYARVLSSGHFIWDQFLNHDPYVRKPHAARRTPHAARASRRPPPLPAHRAIPRCAPRYAGTPQWGLSSTVGEEGNVRG